MARSRKASTPQSMLRIIGGKWRGRKLSFTPAQGLRPTPDRVRETLFNWLAPDINGARCLDLFSGSGALGLEALSRGALSCEFVDTSSAAIHQIEDHLQTLKADTQAYRCHTAPALTFLTDNQGPYDIVFLDPPFGQHMVEPACAKLDSRKLLGPGAHIYVELARGDPAPQVSQHWRLHRDKVAGEVAYRLYEYDEAQQTPPPGQ